MFGCPPTGKQITCGVANVFRIADGRIVEHLTYVTELDTLRQLGAPLLEPWLALMHRAPTARPEMAAKHGRAPDA